MAHDAGRCPTCNSNRRWARISPWCRWADDGIKADATHDPWHDSPVKPDAPRLRDESTPEGRKIWADVEKAASYAPDGLRGCGVVSPSEYQHVKAALEYREDELRETGKAGGRKATQIVGGASRMAVGLEPAPATAVTPNEVSDGRPSYAPLHESARQPSESLREEIERAMRPKVWQDGHGCRVIRAVDAVSVAEEMVLRERNELERERVRLAGCGVAALGYVKEPVPEYGDSASLQDVLRLRKRADAAEDHVRELESVEKRMGVQCRAAEKERDENFGAAIAQQGTIERLKMERDDFKMQAEAQSDRNEYLEKALAEVLSCLKEQRNRLHRLNKSTCEADGVLARCAPEVKP